MSFTSTLEFILHTCSALFSALTHTEHRELVFCFETDVSEYSGGAISVLLMWNICAITLHNSRS